MEAYSKFSLKKHSPMEGIWSLLKCSIDNFAAADLDGLVHRQAETEEDPVPAPPDRQLPDRHRPENRIPCAREHFHVVNIHVAIELSIECQAGCRYAAISFR
jgi:hypothetical protein